MYRIFFIRLCKTVTKPISNKTTGKNLFYFSYFTDLKFYSINSQFNPNSSFFGVPSGRTFTVYIPASGNLTLPRCRV